MNEFNRDVWLANDCQSKQSNFITQHLSIERCDGYDEHNTHIDDIYAEKGSVNGSDYAMNIISSPFMEPEYLEGEFMAEFEKLVRGLGETTDDDVISLSSEDGESYTNRMDPIEGAKVVYRPVVLLDRLPDDYIRLMTQRLDSCMSVDDQSSDEPESGIEMNGEELEETEDSITYDTDEQESDQGKKKYILNDLISEQIAETSNNVAIEEMDLYFVDMADFYGPEVTVGAKTPTPTPNIFLTESITLNTDTFKLRMYQPKVVLAQLPKHTLMEIAQNNNCTKAQAKKQVCILTNEKCIFSSHFELKNIFYCFSYHLVDDKKETSSFKRKEAPVQKKHKKRSEETQQTQGTSIRCRSCIRI